MELSFTKSDPQRTQVFSNISQGMPQFEFISNFPCLFCAPPPTKTFCDVEACCPTTARARNWSRSRRWSSFRDHIRLQSSDGDEPATALMRVHALIVAGHSSAPSTWSVMCEHVSHPVYSSLAPKFGGRLARLPLAVSLARYHRHGQTLGIVPCALMLTCLSVRH